MSARNRPEVGGRYVIGALLAETGGMRTFEATDRWLRREVRFAVASAATEKELGITAKAVAARQSPYVVAVYDCGVANGRSYVVFERTFVLDQAVGADFPWRSAAQVRNAISTLAAGLADLRAIGVDTGGIDPTSIGADGSGQVKVSPWPLAPPAPEARRGWDDLALASYILGRATLHAPEPDAGVLTGIFHRLRQPAGAGAIVDLPQLLDELDAVEPNESETTGQMWVSERTAFLGTPDPPRIFARRGTRPPWLVPVGAAALILLLIGFLTFGLQTPTPPASGDRHGVHRCAAAQCGVRKSTRSTSTTTPSKVPLPAAAKTEVLGTTLANPSPNSTPPSTTAPASGSTTTTAPPETTTTTPQTTTTTTAASPAPAPAVTPAPVVTPAPAVTPAPGP